MNDGSYSLFSPSGSHHSVGVVGVALSSIASTRFEAGWTGFAPMFAFNLRERDRGPMTPSIPATRGQNVARLTIAPLFILVGIMHLTRAGTIAPLMPSVVPHAVAVIVLTGIAEMTGAIGSHISGIAAQTERHAVLRARRLVPIRRFGRRTDFSMIDHS